MFHGLSMTVSFAVQMDVTGMLVTDHMELEHHLCRSQSGLRSNGARVFAHSDRGDPHRVGVERHERDEGAVRVHAVLTDQFVVHRVIVTDDGEATASHRDDTLGSIIDDFVSCLVDLFENGRVLFLEVCG